MSRGSRRWLVLVLPLLLVACASPRGTEESRATLRVENDLIPPTSLSVYAVPEIGSRILVGVVPPGETTTLTFDAAAASDYRFVAETTAGREITSDEITLGSGDGAIWSVNANVVVRM